MIHRRPVGIPGDPCPGGQSDCDMLVSALNSIQRIAQSSNGVFELPEVLSIVMEEATALLGVEGSSICLVDPEFNLNLVKQIGLSTETIKDLSEHKIKVGQCLCGQVASDGVPLILWEPADVEAYISRETQRREGFHFHAAFPLNAKGRTYGVLCAFTKTDDKPSKQSIEALSIMTSQAGLVIENARLYQERLISDGRIREAYVEAFSAVSGGKLLISTHDEVDAMIGESLNPELVLSEAVDIAKGRRYIESTIGDERICRCPSPDDVILACSEAMTNAVKYGGGATISLARSGGMLQVVIRDTGPGIDFHILSRATLMPGFSTQNSLGMGFSMMLQCCSRVALATEPGRTWVLLEFGATE